MKRKGLMLAMVLGLMLLSINAMANDPLYDYWQRQHQRQHQREKMVWPVTTSSNGSTIRIQCGDEIQLELQENGTTGYGWHFDELGGFELVSEKSQEKSDLIGSPTMHIWIFRPRYLGERVIKMSYYREWEVENTDIQRFEVKIIVDCVFR
jgi:predicted secreted protein